MVGQDVVQAPVRQCNVAHVGQAAVDAEVVPRGGGRGGQDLPGIHSGIGRRVHIDGGLRAEDEVHAGRGKRSAADDSECQLAELLGDHDPRDDAAAAVDLKVGAGGTVVIVQPAEHAGLHLAVHLKDRLVALRRLDHNAHAAARAQAGILYVAVPALFARKAEVHIERVEHIRAGNGNVGSGIFQIAGAEGDMHLALDDLQIVADGGELELDGRDADKVAVDGVGQAVEAAAAAPEEGRGHRRDQGDARLHRQRKVEVVGGKAAVVQPLELQLRLCFKEVEGVELQREAVKLLPGKGINVGLDLGELQPQQGAGIQMAVGLDAVLDKADGAVGIFLGPVAQGLQGQQLIRAAVENEVQPHLAGEDEVAVGLEQRLVDLAADLRDVDKHQDGVFLRDHGEGKGLPLQGQAGRRVGGLCRAEEPEARGGVLHHGGGVKAGDKAGLIHPDAEILPRPRPGGGDGGRQGRHAGGEVIVFARAVRLCLEVAPEGVERLAVLGLERGLPGGIGDGRGQHAPLGPVKAQAVGVLRDGDLVRLGELGVFHSPLICAVHIAEAPGVHHSHIGSSTGPDRSAAGLGGEAVCLRVVAHKARRVYAEVGIIEGRPFRQHKGVVHTVAVGVDLSDLTRTGARRPEAGAAEAGGDVGAFVALFRKAADQDMRAAGLPAGMAHAGEAAEILKIAEDKARDIVRCDSAGAPRGARDHRVGAAVFRIVGLP